MATDRWERLREKRSRQHIAGGMPVELAASLAKGEADARRIVEREFGQLAAAKARFDFLPDQSPEGARLYNGCLILDPKTVRRKVPIGSGPLAQLI